MKFLLLLVLLASSATVFAAPKPKVAPKVRWEYAFLEADADRQTYRGAGTSGVEYGAKLRLQGREPIFLNRGEGSDRQLFLLDVFGRLGNQGWELVTTPNYHGPGHYIFKRRK